MTEEKKSDDTEAAKNEFKRVIAIWCEYKMPWKQLCAEKEF